MAIGRIEISAYDGKSDFGVWSTKMRALLSHHKVLIALEPKEDLWSEDCKKRKPEIDEEAYNLLILNISDSVIRKVFGCKTPLHLWGKLETLFSNQSAPNLAYLKASLFSFKMDSSKSVDDNLDEFLKRTLVLRGTDHQLDDTSTVMILMELYP